jgi:hypothetical protein
LTHRAGRGEKKIYSRMGSCIDKATIITEVDRVQGSGESDGSISTVGKLGRSSEALSFAHARIRSTAGPNRPTGE